MKILVSPVCGLECSWPLLQRLGDLGTVFEGVHGGGADGYDAAVFGAGAVEGFGLFLRGRCSVRGAGGFRRHARRGSGAKVPRPTWRVILSYLYAACLAMVSRTDFGGEVEAGGRGGYGAAVMGEDGLIAFAVGLCVVSLDVGREGDVADLL